MLNFPGLRGPADVIEGGPHAGTPGPAKGKEQAVTRSCHRGASHTGSLSASCALFADTTDPTGPGGWSIWKAQNKLK